MKIEIVMTKRKNRHWGIVIGATIAILLLIYWLVVMLDLSAYVTE